MDNIYVRVIRLIDGISEMTVPCIDGYNIYLDDRLSPQGRDRAYRHAIAHIKHNDFENRQDKNVQSIERERHA